MNYKVTYTAAYNKKASKFLKKHPSLIDKYQKTIELLETNPHHPSLRLHKLEGRLNDCHSVSINLSYRIVIYFLIADNEIVPVDVGDHDAVY
ncbi:MAG: type II toxin-antitoxin system YafQ family toxin [Moraxellaceae bacterium]|nr:type II toxin-antitoxin system YafQ family toxin [Moraxellaceae bacterium]MBL0230450.1 type II toxin-antitoxin system YafQ family toxin [Moraxellaceae bacterium]